MIIIWWFEEAPNFWFYREVSRCNNILGYEESGIFQMMHNDLWLMAMVVEWVADFNFEG